MTTFVVVLDTNVLLAAYGSDAPKSPNREILARWESGEFTLLYSDDILLEYIEKLIEKGASGTTVRQLISSVLGTGERVEIESFHLRRYPSDTDDIAFVLCALNGDATHLVTYDGGFAEVVRDCPFAICEPLAFLRELRRNL